MLDLFNLKAKAEALQKQAKEATERLEKIEVTETSSDESVKIRINGNGRITAIELDPSACLPEKAETLQNSILTTIQSATARALMLKRMELDQATGGMFSKAGGDGMDMSAFGL